MAGRSPLPDVEGQSLLPDPELPPEDPEPLVEEAGLVEELEGLSVEGEEGVGEDAGFF